MTIEIANRLCAYRKHSGFSQEELAEKVGVTRQAVSKWERAEASPDLDNLILLSEIYGVTLDELLHNNPKTQEVLQKDKVEISLNGIHIEDKKGKTVHINMSDTAAFKNGHIFGTTKKSEFQKNWNRVPWPVFCAILYLIFGILNLLGGWAYSWVIFLTIPLYYTLGTAIAKCDGSLFAFPVLVAMAYLICGMYFTLWHPSWIMFLLIPIYYWICNRIKPQN